MLRRLGVLGVTVVLAVALSGSVSGVGHSESAPLPSFAFTPVTIPQPTPVASDTLLSLPSPTMSPTPEPTPAPTKRPKAANRGSGRPHRLTGEASWGPFGGHVVTRLKRGTPIRVCGVETGRCWRGRSWGYGPAKWTHRIVDLDRRVFARLCGDPILLGVCDVHLSW